MKEVRKLVPGWFATMIAASAAVCVVGLTQPTQPKMENTTSVSAVETQNTKELYDVLWLDRYPETSSDTFRAYSFTSDNVGFSIDFHSSFKFTLELFEFKANNSQITFHFPHDARRAQVSYKIEKLKKPTRNFDVSLTVEKDPANQGQTTVYFSGPNFRSIDSMPENVRLPLETTGALNHLKAH